MKISIFSPTHNPKYLNRLWESIKCQTYSNWEWVIVPNNGIKIEPFNDNRIKIIPCEIYNKIGALKKFAIANSSGDIVLEADHDDELFPTALEECAKAFEDPTIDFAYSNCCDVTKNYTPRTFGSNYGWENRSCKYKDYNLLEIVSFPPSPSMFSKIWYAPNHFRAWKKSFYNLIGGHNESMEILDDQDILARTYIKGNVKHIDKPLYVYHIHEGNTCYGEVNAKIQEMTLDIHDKYIYELVEKWCDLNKLKKIDLCGGFSKPHGYESIDKFNGDIISDLDEKWPFEDGTVGLIRAHDALEHLKNPIHTMKEAYRCLAPNGWFLTQTPSTDGRGAFQDPTHISFWNSNSFWYYTKEQQAKYIGNPVRFQLNRIKNFYPTDWHKTHLITYVKADLVKLPDPKLKTRIPGIIEI